MNDDKRMLEVVTVLEDGSRGRLDRVTKAMDVDDLRERLSDFMAKLQAMATISEGETPFELQQIEFTAEITASGEFKLMGTGVGVEASNSLTFVLRRRN